MLAGRPPFAEGTLVQKLLQHQQTPPPAIEWRDTSGDSTRSLSMEAQDPLARQAVRRATSNRADTTARC